MDNIRFIDDEIENINYYIDKEINKIENMYMKKLFDKLNYYYNEKIDILMNEIKNNKLIETEF